MTREEQIKWSESEIVVQVVVQFKPHQSWVSFPGVSSVSPATGAACPPVSGGDGEQCY